MPKAKTCKSIKGLNIYKITSKNTNRDQWDSAYGFIINAKNESSARQMIYDDELYGDESIEIIDKKFVKLDFWLNPDYSNCELIGKSCLQNEGIVMRDFQYG